MAVRMHHPETIHFVTNRCEQEMFRLIPHENIKALIVEWLARALTYVDGGIEIYAYCFLSNHIHLLLRDKSGKLAKFMGYFQGNLARAINRELGIKGHFWGREYHDLIVETEADLLDRYCYTTCNAVKAGLVEKTSDWTGVCSYEQAKSGEVIEVTVINRTKKHHLTRHGRQVDPSLYTETHELALTPLPMYVDFNQETMAQRVEELVTEADQRFRALLDHRPVVGMAMVLACHYTDRPENPSRTPRRLAFSLDRETEKILRNKIVDHTNEYRSAYGVYATWAIAGRRPIVEWPVGSYPPSCHEPRQAT
jgi:REP element-mobilizing transposase RayT